MRDVAHIPFVIADDLSGAAEIAGAALRHGWDPRLLRYTTTVPMIASDRAVVIDTDSRGMAPAAAAQKAHAAFASIAAHGGEPFKKIDSLLRGPVLAEIEAALEALRRDTVLLLSQNPSRGRCVVDGRYLVDGVPLHETSFRDDPEYPRFSADVRELLGPSTRPVVVLRPGDSIRTGAINVACASTLDQVRGWSRVIAPNVLPVGGFDLFSAILSRPALLRPAANTIEAGGPRLILSGSASAYARGLPALAAAINVPAFTVPASVFASSDAVDNSWHDPIVTAIQDRSICVVTVGYSRVAGAGVGARLQRVLADCAADVFARTHARLFVDGGATASAVIERLGWRDLDVRAELAPGVVELHAPPVNGIITIKPGSYAWPEQVWI